MLALVRVVVVMVGAVIGLVQAGPAAYPRGVEENEEADGRDREKEGRFPSDHLVEGRPHAV
jgi:hypothetical protein